MTRRRGGELPGGQRTLWAGIRGPLETALVSALLTWGETTRWNVDGELRKVIEIARSPAGEWLAGQWRDGVFVPTGKVRGAPTGWADLSGFVPKSAPKRAGRHVAIEAKRDRYAKPTREQIEHLSVVVESGGVGILAVDVEQCEREYLEAIGLKRTAGGIIVPA